MKDAVLSQAETPRIANYLGLAQKAGKIAAGDQAVEKALAQGQAQLLVLAADLAESLTEFFRQQAAAREIPVLCWRDKQELGLLVGKSRRGALAVLDAGFAQAIMKTLQE